MSASSSGSAPWGAPSEPAAVIHDIRYSRFEGELRPRWASVAALARSSATRAVGLRRSAGAKVWPFLLLAGAYLVPLGVVAGAAAAGDDEGPTGLLSYVDLLGTETVLMVAFVASTVPSIVTRDRRDRVLSLYFSTAVSPAEYVVGKLLAAWSLVLLIVLGPLLVEFVGGLLVADSPGAALRDQGGDLWRILVAAALIAAYHGTAAVVIGSLTPRRVFAVCAYVGAVLVPSALANVLAELTGHEGFRALDLLLVPYRLAAWPLRADVTGPPALLALVWLLVVVGGAAVLGLRYLHAREG